MLEDRLIYKEIDVTLGNFSVEYDGIPVVHPLQGTARAKVNRLYGDFSHPQVVAELALGEVSVDMFDACLSTLIQLQDALVTPEVAAGDTWRIQRTISAGVGWEALRLRWLAGDVALRHQFSVHAGRSSVRTRVSFPRSRSSDVSLDVTDFQVLHSKGMESIDIPTGGGPDPLLCAVVLVGSADIQHEGSTPFDGRPLRNDRHPARGRPQGREQLREVDDQV